MKRKSILALLLVVMIVVSISLVSCGRKYSNGTTGNNAVGTPNIGNNAASAPNTQDNTANNPNVANDATGNINNDVNNAIESGKDNVEAAGNSLKYTAMNFRDDVINAGYKLKDSTNTKKSYFAGNETDYLMGNNVVRVYEYNSANDLQSDISRISQNGLNISGTDANYTEKPYFYSKGNSLIVYEGNEPAYIDEFNTMYGNTLIP